MAVDDYKAKTVALYFADLKGAKLSMTIEALDGESEALLDSQTISDFHSGVYLKYSVKGHVKFRIKDNTDDSRGTVISGVFLIQHRRALSNLPGKKREDARLSDGSALKTRSIGRLLRHLVGDQSIHQSHRPQST
ncbi:MAG: hypothetical protein FJ403_16925 [Verrucomicrobia bacterium]|nr:hypothetical protein [Verrucomicrobiota bacterium]